VKISRSRGCVLCTSHALLPFFKIFFSLVAHTHTHTHTQHLCFLHTNKTFTMYLTAESRGLSIQMHCCYIDSPDELASGDILAELGIRLGSGSPPDTEFELENIRSTQVNKWLAEYGREYRSDCRILYVIKDDACFLDIRDSGDYWIRCYVSPNDWVVIPPEKYHRIVFKNGCDCTVIASSWTAAPSRIPRFPLETDGFAIIQRHSFRKLS
jgi:hypothetical protein